MDTIYLKINIKNDDLEPDKIREEGLFFENIANALSLDKRQIIEIDESNFLKETELIKHKFNDKSRSNKESFRRP